MRTLVWQRMRTLLLMSPIPSPARLFWWQRHPQPAPDPAHVWEGCGVHVGERQHAPVGRLQLERQVDLQAAVEAQAVHLLPKPGRQHEAVLPAVAAPVKHEVTHTRAAPRELGCGPQGGGGQAGGSAPAERLLRGGGNQPGGRQTGTLGTPRAQERYRKRARCVHTGPSQAAGCRPNRSEGCWPQNRHRGRGTTAVQHVLAPLAASRCGRQTPGPRCRSSRPAEARAAAARVWGRRRTPPHRS